LRHQLYLFYFLLHWEAQLVGAPDVSTSDVSGPAVMLGQMSNLTIHIMTANRTKQRYRELKQPPLNPPAYVFGPVWTVLYAAMGYAAHRAWTTGITSLNPEKVSLAKQGATLFTIQLGLNLLWMPTFFILERPIEATADSIALLGTNVYLTYLWSKVDDVAALVMLPYVGWLSFATYLSVR
jgi:translocator protein